MRQLSQIIQQIRHLMCRCPFPPQRAVFSAHYNLQFRSRYLPGLHHALRCPNKGTADCRSGYEAPVYRMVNFSKTGMRCTSACCAIGAIVQYLNRPIVLLPQMLRQALRNGSQQAGALHNPFQNPMLKPRGKTHSSSEDRLECLENQQSRSSVGNALPTKKPKNRSDIGRKEEYKWLISPCWISLQACRYPFKNIDNSAIANQHIQRKTVQCAARQTDAGFLLQIGAKVGSISFCSTARSARRKSILGMESNLGITRYKVTAS